MKLYRKLVIIISCLIVVNFFLSCAGYNKKMYMYLSDINNYETYEVKIDNIYFENINTGKREIFIKELCDESVLSAATYLTGLEIDLAYGRSGLKINGENLESPLVYLEITEKNNRILLDKGFYIDYLADDKVKIHASNYIYMDTDFFYVISVEYKGKIYLEKEEGLNNIIEMMNENRSLF